MVPVYIPNQPVIETQTRKMEVMAHKSEEVLVRARAVFPFAFFPDEISVDKNKVNIINRIFLWSEKIHSIPFEEIGDVIVETGPFFATIRILHLRGLPGGHSELNYLWKNEALHVRKVIQGLILARKDQIDLAPVAKTALVQNAVLSGTI